MRRRVPRTLRRGVMPSSPRGRHATLQAPIGKGTYRGRPVLVFEIMGTGMVNGEPMGLHAYRFLDVATGLWSHSELITEVTFTDNGTKVPLRFQVIDDVQF